MHLTSAAFIDGAELPRRCIREEGNISPPLRWAGAPANAKSFAVLCRSSGGPANKSHHWAAYDIPAYRTELVEGAGAPEGFEDFRHAINDFGHFGYGGPSLPHAAGGQHIRFRILALSCAELPVRTHPTCEEIEKEAEKYVIGSASLVAVLR
jgi:Raf kinase inhibitor-like YbhB/YbcL family protein